MVRYFILTHMCRTLDVASNILTTFVMHASLLRLSASFDRHQIISDMTALELTLSQFLSDTSRLLSCKSLTLHDCDVPFQVARSFRTLLFEPTAAWKQPANFCRKWHLPKVIIVQHLLSRSSTLPLANDIRGMGKHAYVDWAISTSRVKHAFFSERVDKTMIQELHHWLDLEGRKMDSSTLDKMDKEVLCCLVEWDTFLIKTL